MIFFYEIVDCIPETMIVHIFLSCELPPVLELILVIVECLKRRWGKEDKGDCGTGPNNLSTLKNYVDDYWFIGFECSASENLFAMVFFKTVFVFLSGICGILFLVEHFG